MSRGQFGAVSLQFQRLLGPGTVAGSTEWQLLHRYLAQRDEVAFEAIVARHGPMVLGVCRRTLGSGSPDVDDAFQATFLTLARKAETLGEHDPVGHWLHGVAYRVALRARSAAARRRSLERSSQPAETSEVDDASRLEQIALIDQELARLPRKYRVPVVLCYLEGLTHDEAAQELGWPLGTVKGRLSRARELLKGRLARRGVMPVVASALIASASEVGATVPALLLRSTIQISMAAHVPGMVPVGVAALLKGSFLTMILGNMKKAGVILMVLGSGAAVMAYQGGRKTDEPARSDQEQAKTTRSAPAARIAPPPVQAPASEIDAPLASWALIVDESTDANPAITKAILAKLDEKVSMNFPTDSPLMDVMKYIEQATQDAKVGLPSGIPVYVDPQGLQDADKTMASTVSISLEGVPLKVSLGLILKQLSLTFYVKDGLMIITFNSDEDGPPYPLAIMERKAARGELTRDQYKQLIEMLKLRNQVRELNTNQGFQ